MNGYKKQYMGKLESGEEIYAHTVSNGKLSITVLDYGATLQKFVYDGVDVVCGYDTLEDYIKSDGYVGAVVGRCANRIAGGKLTLDGVDYFLDCNDGAAHLHGGVKGYDKRFWYVEDGVTHEGCPSIACGLISSDGDEGYPGRIQMSVNYILRNKSLIIDYKYYAPFTKSYCNLTHHAYFNLDGAGEGDVRNHKLTVFADQYNEVDPNTLIPSGKRIKVDGTAMDFREEKTIGADMENTGLPYPGYDHNFHIIPKIKERFEGLGLRHAAIYRNDDKELHVLTSLPCMQLYTGNFLGNGANFKGGVKQHKYHGVCFESQFEPDSIDSGLSLVEPLKEYHHVTVFRFK